MIDKKQIKVILFCLLLTTTVYAQQPVSIIPEPVAMQQLSGSFELPANIGVALPDGDLGHTFDLLRSKITTAWGYTVSKTNSAKAHIVLSLNSAENGQLGEEGYALAVEKDKVNISANTPAGLFYGVQTLLQLFPADIESNEPLDGIKWRIPLVRITDYPRVGWRGLMLDVSRHFFTVDEVKRYIDNMSRFKYNIFHLHLTDDEGWRVEIKSYPRLTEVGAWRVGKTGNFNFMSTPEPDEPKDYGGFYTQEDMKELVRYAKDRFINILPEIDVPGHSTAAIVAYPELSCTEGADKYTVHAGQGFLDWSKGAPPIAAIDNTLCPANEKVYEFMGKVLAEIAALFPFEYIHVGGDEAPHNFWEKNDQIRALMEREGLKSIPEVQSYFEKRVEKIVHGLDKKMIGWDELLEGGVSKTTAIMSWRKGKAGIGASNKGHKVVFSTSNEAYYNLMQGDRSTDPPLPFPLSMTLRFVDAYNKFDPIPADADARYVLGGQANLWTEMIYNSRQLEYMTWPRGLAMAENLWSPPEHKDWKHFSEKAQQFFKRFDAAEIKYSRAIYDPIVSLSRAGEKYFVSLRTEIEGLDAYLSFDYSEPDNFYPRYTGPIEIPKDAVIMRVTTYRDGKRIGRMLNISLADLKKEVR
ncbi:family 20 glycosylhydrolase [Sphingobacterium sp. SGG-5]|uniref:beta-N-acetylhexosaminidase n=1 Tax=Sphingobacterium sp. SGG-5 TaxID=2710881 RepID=UPI0013EC37A2|nr:family 20 glycosylhydrolase [Sphingobacterium sp. SGG-5]NGM61102.1 family 20 glycosylhydrolase [Sphingobacterium sp. SGG-5]